MLPKTGLMLKSNMILKLGFILKLNMMLKLGFIPKVVNIQNFELILNNLEYPRPSISSLKQPGRLKVCYLEITLLGYMTSLCLRFCHRYHSNHNFYYFP